MLYNAVILTKHNCSDLDQISTDLRQPRRLAQHLSTLPLEELPALGQLYCTPCAKFLETEQALTHHQRSKTHKKRVKTLKEPAYTHEEANAAVGRGIDNGKSRVKPEEVLMTIQRERLLGLGSAPEDASEMEVEASHAEAAPALVHQEEEDL